MDASERRLLLQRRRLLIKRVGRAEEFLRGSIVLMKRKCIRPRCRRCAEGRGHPTWVLCVSESGRTRTVYLGEGRLAEARRLAANYRRVTEWVEAISRINLELLRAGGAQGKRGSDGKAR